MATMSWQAEYIENYKRQREREKARDKREREREPPCISSYGAASLHIWMSSWGQGLHVAQVPEQALKWQQRSRGGPCGQGGQQQRRHGRGHQGLAHFMGRRLCNDGIAEEIVHTEA